MPDVGGIADFAGFAVADNVNACLNLFGHHVEHFFLHHAVKRGFVIAHAAVLCKQLGDDTFRARQATDVGGENTA